MQQVSRGLAWRSTQPPIIQWLIAFGLFAVAFIVLVAVGCLHGANTGLTFFPVLLFAAVVLTWRQAAFMMLLAVCAGAYLFIPPGDYLVPVGWAVVGGLNILIITALKHQAQELAAANERQRLLFRELQHRVANTLQAASGALEGARRRMALSPAQAAELMENATRRLAASADIHRRLNDPVLFEHGLAPILRDAVSSVIDPQLVELIFDVQELDLSFGHMSTLTMLVIEVANNAQKHVFQYGLGRRFTLSLRSVSRSRAALIMTDDGPGVNHRLDPDIADLRLGSRIIQELASQLGGDLQAASGPGMAIVIEFPCPRQPARNHRPPESRVHAGGPKTRMRETVEL